MQFDFLSTKSVGTRTEQMAELTQERGFARFSEVHPRRVLIRIQRELLVYARQGVKQMSKASMEGPED